MSLNTCDHNSFIVVYEGRNCPVCVEQEEYAKEVEVLKNNLSQEEMMRENAEQEFENADAELERIYKTYDFVMKMEDATNGRTVHNK
jgi:uncharacterized protein YecT (DUF1311 family)